MVLERPVFLCIGLAATCWSQCIIAESLGAVEIRKLPPIGKTIDAFPRIARGASPAAIMRINRILERADDSLRSKQARCARDTPEGSVERTVDVTMVGPSYVSFLSHDNDYCGNVLSRRLPFTFDLSSGLLVDWQQLLPGLKARSKTPFQKMKDSGSHSYTSALLSAIFLKLWRQARVKAGQQGKEDEECLSALDKDSISFLLWLDPKNGGVIVEPNSPQRWTGACGEQLPIPLEGLKSLGASAHLLNALKAATR